MASHPKALPSRDLPTSPPTNPRPGAVRVLQAKWLRRTLEAMEMGCEAYRADLKAKSDDEVYFWLDYLVLRQCARLS